MTYDAFRKIYRVAKKVWEKTYSDGCTFDQFLELSQKLCHYCCSPPSSTSKFFTYNGLDRKDSSGDHSLINVVPCCGKCNMMKGTMGYNEFLSRVSKIHANIPKLITSYTTSTLPIEEGPNFLVEGWFELQNVAKVNHLSARAAYKMLKDGIDAPTLRKVLENNSADKTIPLPHTIGRKLRDVRNIPFAGNAMCF